MTARSLTEGLSAARSQVTSRVDTATMAVALMSGAWALLMGGLSVARHRAFFTGRFDLGNMTQAVWSTAQGRPLETTDAATGEQFVRLGAHVDPILVVFTPLYWVWPSPEMLLVAQAIIVALGAFPAFWLGRRWLGDDRLAVAAAAVYLLYPPLAWATLTEFHPVTLAAPLLLFAIWAAEVRRYGLLALASLAALLTKEQVGLALAVLGLWMVVRGARRAGAVLAGVSAAWVAIGVWLIIPRFNSAGESAFIGRYEALGDSPGGVVSGLVLRPWDAAEVAATPDRGGYLLALLLPLALLPLAAPLLAAAAVPEILLNVLSNWWPQYSIEFQYVAVIAPFLIAASILGLARLRRARRPEVLVRAMERPVPLAAGVVAWVALSGVVLGPLPWWSAVPLGSDNRSQEYSATAHTDAQRAGLAMIPDHVPVSAGNRFGAHLSERRRIHTFPVVADAEWVIVDATAPFIADRPDPRVHRARLGALRRNPAFTTVFQRDGVVVLRRSAAP
ncbi:MAG: DUF2079 domain-containing protein [Miltoncostaeaceae bacterium]